MSCTVHTTPSRALPIGAAVTASVRPRCSIVTSLCIAASSGGSGLDLASTRLPTGSSGTRSPARGLTVATVVEPGSVTISASPRLSIVTASRRRSSSIRP